MQANLTRLMCSSRSCATKTWTAMFFVLTLCLSAAVASAQTVPPVILSQTTWLNTLQGGGAITSGDPAGTSFAVNQNGDVILANASKILLFNGQTGAVTTLGTWSNAQAVTVDSHNNLYVANLYSDTIVKVPFVNGAYAAFTSSPAGACTGSDTVACTLPNLTVASNGYYFQVNAIAFDAQGDFFWTVNNSGTGANGIFECSAACLYGSGASAQLIYQEPTTTPTPTSTSGTGQLIVGGIAIDPWGNIFFTDSSIYITSSYGIESYSSSVKEIPTSTGAGYGGATTGYAAAPITLFSETDASPAAYDDELDGVAIDSNGTVYVADQYNGIFAIPNDGGTIPMTGGQPTDMYAVSPQGGKTLAIDGKGNLYVASYSTESGSGTDSLARISAGSLAAPATAVGTQFTVSNITAVVNDGAASPVLTFTAYSNGKAIPSGNISATTGTSASLFNGTAFPVTLKASPGSVGEQSAVLTATETVNSTTGSATIYTIGEGAALTIDPGFLTSYTSGFTGPTGIASDQKGDLFIADIGASAVYEIANGTTTPVSIGSGFQSPTGTAVDANGDLYIADSSLGEIIEIPNTSTTGGFTAGTQKTVVSSSMTFAGTALSHPQRLAVGPDGVLYITDLSNNRIVTYNPSNGDTGVFAAGLNDPQGIAVDGSGNVYVANQGAQDVLVYSGGGAITTLSSIPGVTTPLGVAVDPSGSVLVSDSTTGDVVRIPNETGALTVADTITVESSVSANGIALDASGNLYLADYQGAAVYADNRTMPSVNFGTVNNPNSGMATVYVESAGNMSATLGTPFIGMPTNSDFTVVAGGTHGCSDGGSGPAGKYCELTATYTPTVSDNGTITGTSTLTATAPAASYTLTMSGVSVGTVPPTPQVITGFPSTGDAVVGQQIMLSATGGSTIPVVFTIDGASTGTGTISGNTLTVTGAGTLVIDANEAGGTVSGVVYTAAPQEQDTITVTTATEPGGASSDTGFIVSQATQIGALTGGGWNPSQSPLSGTFVVGANGDVIISDGYGSGVLDITQSGTQTTLASLGNSTAAAIDSSGNVYVASYADYSGAATIYKIPYDTSSKTYKGFTTAPATDCVGGDTTACVYAPNLTASIFASGHSGYSAMTFDASGNLFVETSAYATGNPNKIYECSATCQTSATGTPTLLYTDSMSLGAIAVDPWDNLFFGDGSNAAGSGVTYLEELAYTSGTGYAASPTTLESYTNAAGYGNGISGVATDANGTIYFATDGDGIFAIPNTQAGGPDLANAYAVSTVGGKGITLDPQGNLYQIPYNGGDVVDRIQINNVTAPSATVDGAATSASVTVTDNYNGCADSPVLAIASSNADFSATAGTSCSASLGTGNGTFSPALSVMGGNFPATVKFAPTASGGGTETTTLTISDTTNGGEGTATASGVGELTGQTITFTALSSPVTYSSGLTITLNATGGASGNPVVFTIDGTSTGTGTISGNTLTVTGAGTIVIDANQAGGGGYGAATQAQQSVVVNQASQTITITSPAANAQINEPTNDMISLVATGGASGNAVTFTIDGSSTGTGTISGSTLTVTGLGTFVIDANQAGNTNYLAAAQASVTFTVVPSNPQTISFTQPASPVTFAYGMTIPLVATGGGSGNPVVFTIDGSSTGTGIISGSTLTVTGAGTIVIDANQAASAGYAQAAQVQVSVVVNPAAQTITFTQPTSPVTYTSGLTIPLVATGGMSGNAVTFTIDASSTATGTISGDTLTVTGAGTCNATTNPGCAGNIVIDANQAGTTNYSPAAQVQMTVVVYATAPTFTFTAPPSSLTVATGSSASTTITISPEYGFSGTITFACSNLPVGDTCTFTPPSLTFTSTSNASQTTTFTVNSSAQTAANHHDSLPLFPAATMAAALCFLGFKKRNRLQLLVLLAVSLAGLGLMSGCGGKFHSTQPTVTHATITITATSGSTQQSTTLTLWQQ